MANEIRPDYDSMHLFPPALEDWVPADHPARFIRDFVDALDLEALGFRARRSERGRSNYALDLLLKVWLYGYFNRIRSTRDLERACHEHLSLIWLTGMKYPDHNTLWRFLRNNSEAIRNAFAAGVRIAASSDLVGMVLHALDGTKIRAQASRHTAHHREQLERALKDLDSKFDEMFSEVEAAESEQEGDYKLPEELQDAENRRQVIRDALAELDNAQTDHLQPAEPDARMMKCDGKTDFGYNSQAVVDEQSGLIVAADVTAQETDYEQLVPMVKMVDDVIGDTAEETVADRGYSSGPALHEAQEEGLDVLVHLQPHMDEPEDPDEFHCSRFQHDTQSDVIICPHGKTLTFEQEKWDCSNKYKVRVYRCQSFRDCPDRDRCSPSKRGRTVRVNPYKSAVEKQIEKQQTPEAKRSLSRRKVIVEPPFGTIKEGMSFRRFTVRNLDGVRMQWALVCFAFNLRKLYRSWCEGALVLSAC
jgi:transposase